MLSGFLVHMVLVLLFIVGKAESKGLRQISVDAQK